MPRIVTYDELRGFAADATAKRLLKEASTKSPSTAGVFLSHSSKDDDLVAGVVQVLENHGGNVYVDHADPTISKTDCLQIAKHLRDVIRQCKKLVLLATPRSKESKWMPWELGLADGIHNTSNVAIFPSAETSLEYFWSEQEYLGLYHRIVWGQISSSDQAVWMVWDSRTNTAIKLREWLTF